MNFPTATLRRLLKPFILVGPLMALIALPATAYGLSSNHAVAAADAALMKALLSDGKVVTVDASFVCPGSKIQAEALAFRRLDLTPEAHQMRLTTIGFDEAAVDLSTTTGISPIISAVNRQETSPPHSPGETELITMELRRPGDRWCLFDISIADKA